MRSRNRIVVNEAGMLELQAANVLVELAIQQARTDPAARECIAESMQRGTPELTMQDAVRAAQTEVRRAARYRDTAMATGPVVGAPSAGRELGMSRSAVGRPLRRGSRGRYGRDQRGFRPPHRISWSVARTTDIPARPPPVRNARPLSDL